MTRLISNLPETTNGLDAISDDILANPRAERIVVAIVDCPKAHDDFDNARRIPYMRVRAVEPILNSTDAKAVRDILETAYTKRTGQDSLTLDAIATTAETGKPCPAWWSEADGDDTDPCVYEEGHGGLHKLRSGATWADGADSLDFGDDQVQPAFQEPTNDD